MRARYALALLLLPAPATAQTGGLPAGMPLVVDMQKVEVGAWAEYVATVEKRPFTSRWALVARDAKSNTLEMTTKGKEFKKPMILRVVLPADPTSKDRLPKPPLVQLGDDAPMLAPPDFPPPKFQRPDPADLVGQEEIKVPAGTFPTSHYRQKNASGTVDIWVSETMPPIGIVKAVNTPEPDKSLPPSMQSSPSTQELVAVGRGAKPAVTKKPVPFDTSRLRSAVELPQGVRE
jgi:hypothetical protein